MAARNGLQRPCKPETLAQSIMRDAMSALRLVTVAKGQRFEWRSELPDDVCTVKFWGGSAFTKSGEVTLESGRYGQWIANLNDGQRIGKPWQRRTPEEVQAYRAAQEVA